MDIKILTINIIIIESKIKEFLLNKKIWLTSLCFLTLLSCQFDGKQNIRKDNHQKVYFDFADNLPKAWEDTGVVVQNYVDGSSLSTLLRGWDVFYRQADEYPPVRVWATDWECTLKLPLTYLGPKILLLRMVPCTTPSLPFQNVNVFINGRPLGFLLLSPILQTYSLEVPGEVLRIGDNIIRFNFRDLNTPSLYGFSGDRRMLAARLEWLKLIPKDRPQYGARVEQVNGQKAVLLPIPGSIEYEVLNFPKNAHLKLTSQIVKQFPQGFKETDLEALKISFDIFSRTRNELPKQIYNHIISFPDGKKDTKDPLESEINKIDIDLSDVEGKDGSIIFSTNLNGEYVDPLKLRYYYSAWITPRIEIQPEGSKPVKTYANELSEKPNLILITLDTLRADNLSSYGYPLPISPVLDKLALQGVTFSRCIAAAPCTTAAHATIMTSRYPTEHNAHGGTLAAISSECPTLAEILKQAGYLTAAWVNLATVKSNFGFNRGFEYFDEFFPGGGRFAIDTLDHVQYWITKHSKTFRRGSNASRNTDQADSSRAEKTSERKPFFIWLHYGEPHTDYSPHSPFIEMLDPGYSGELMNIDNNFIKLYCHPEDKLAQEDLARAKALYDNEVRYLDDILLEILRTVKLTGIEEETLIVLVSDHGEEFKEHGSLVHDQTLYREVLEVPLILRYPSKLPASKIVKNQVHHIDIAPTILDVLNLPIPEYFRGKSLLTYLNDENSQTERILFSEKQRPPQIFYKDYIFSALTPQYKLIIDATNRPELYNLEQDPQEKANLLAQQDQKSEAIAKVEEKLLSALEPFLEVERKTSKETPQIPEETKEALKALGYLGN